MTPHRWIRRRSGLVQLYVNGVVVGCVRRVGCVSDDSDMWRAEHGCFGQEWPTKAEAKRALLRAVMAPRVKGEAKAPANGWVAFATVSTSEPSARTTMAHGARDASTATRLRLASSQPGPKPAPGSSGGRRGRRDAGRSR